MILTAAALHPNIPTWEWVETFMPSVKGVDSVMDDFTDDSVLATHDATYRGLAGIRAFFAAMIDGLPEGFDEAVKITRREVVGEVAFLRKQNPGPYSACKITFIAFSFAALPNTR